ncbi:phosphotransferase [Streptomyces sp. NPDC048636]|uniref:phosphotransferase family protein n=1 Tax=Streptomyces sp. NPDC048636 TaxID=3155762 RepID=UPI0034141FD5
MIERVEWDDLPVEFRTAVEARTGPVVAAESVAEGLNCSAALILTTERSGTHFLKGVRHTDGPGIEALRCEERINETVGGISPTIRHRVDAGGWLALAFVYVPGSHADLGPGSKDLDAVAAALERMQHLRPPVDVPVPPLVDRFKGFLEPGEAERLAGDCLLHTDTNPHNLLIDHGGEAYVVDWAMPAIGPAWVDAAYTAVRLMECEQSPTDALAWLDGITSWRQADERAVEAFVTATCRHWAAAVGEKDAEPSNRRVRYLLKYDWPTAARQPGRRRVRQAL